MKDTKENRGAGGGEKGGGDSRQSPRLPPTLEFHFNAAIQAQSTGKFLHPADISLVKFSH